MARIVVVDDEEQTCKYLERQFVSDGHEVRTSLTGHEAIDLGHLFRPDILIADWIVIDDSWDPVRMVGSIRALEDCLQCHTARRDELLGAFTHEFSKK